MNFFLNKNQLDYIFFHLNFVFEITDEIRNLFLFVKNKNEIINESNKIIFLLSDEDYFENNVKYINNIPVLFSLEADEFFSFQNSNLIFEHDLLKSSFYLLSGYQEYVSKEKDFLDRFPYKNSIQQRLCFVKKPIVNYYFEIISNGISKFCERNKIKFQKKQLFENYGFMLTHDIDRINTYDIFEVILKVKQFLGLSKTNIHKKTVFKLMIKYFFHFINIFDKRNPDWSFDLMRNIERENNFKSVFFFLHKDKLHKDSRYTFEDKKIKNIIIFLINEGCEIALHGTVGSAKNTEKMQDIKKKLQKVSSQKIVGVRQHFLKYEHITTIKIQEKTNLQYDSTLGFAAHEGFRNSYCLPFKLYDFENNRIIDTWEIPLNMMDTTILNYRKLSYQEATDSVFELIREIKKFNGIFTLLWHNNFYDEDIYPGVIKFYTKLLKQINNSKAQSILGMEFINMINNDK